MKHTLLVMLGCLACGLFLAPCQVAQAQPPVYQFKCDPVPIPTENRRQTQSFALSVESDQFSLDVWRYPCDQDFSFVIFTVRPAPDSTPRARTLGACLVYHAGVDVHAWVFMTNHVHLLAETEASSQG